MAVNKKINLIVASRYMKNCLLQNGFEERKINILPYYCKDYGSRDRHFDDFILFVGRIWLYKGIQFLVRALKDLPKSLKLVIAGDGDYLNDIKSLAADLGLENRIIFLGRVSNDDLEQYYHKCLALAVPSIWAEPFGIIGIEAMASGKPVIAFDVGGISDWLEDNKSGFLVERGNVAGLVEKINILLNNRELAAKMGDCGRKLYEQKYTVEHHIEKLLEIFELIKESHESIR
jgi:glycosyltransferase involved in cell wall biosynthesis